MFCAKVCRVIWRAWRTTPRQYLPGLPAYLLFFPPPPAGGARAAPFLRPSAGHFSAQSWGSSEPGRARGSLALRAPALSSRGALRRGARAHLFRGGGRRALLAGACAQSPTAFKGTLGHTRQGPRRRRRAPQANPCPRPPGARACSAPAPGDGAAGAPSAGATPREKERLRDNRAPGRSTGAEGAFRRTLRYGQAPERVALGRAFRTNTARTELLKGTKGAGTIWE